MQNSKCKIHKARLQRSVHFAFCVFNFAFPLCPTPACAAEGKDGAKKSDPEAEAREAAKEDAEEAAITNMAEQLRKYQHEFHGTFLLPADPSQKTSAGVVGTFVTDEKDRNPNQTYLVKVADGNKELLGKLKRFDMKKVAVQGKLRNQGKYLIASAVSEPAAGQPVKERRGGGGI